MNAPLYRAYHAPTNRFIEGKLSTNNKFYTAEGIPMSDVEVDLCTGLVAESGHVVYQNDVVEVATLNEFGSQTVRSGTVRYDVMMLAYIVTSPDQPDDPRPLPTKILRVIGHDHASH